MVGSVPLWSLTPRGSLTDWYGHVSLLPQHVLGQWFCAERFSGTLLWQRRFARPNTVMGVSSGVIVASEMRSDGPWTAQFGCYGISLQTGRLLWTSHANGVWGGLLRALDWVPGFTNDFRDAVSLVEGAECFCSSGRVLDVRTGKMLRRVPREEVRRRWDQQPRSDAEVLYDDDIRKEPSPVRVTEGGWLSRRLAGAKEEGFHLYMSGEEGKAIWGFDVASTGYCMSQASFYDYRYARSHIYLIVSEELTYKLDPAHRWRIRNPTIFHLLTLELERGKVVQDIRINDEPVEKCRLEDVDEQAVLISIGRRHLRCYARAGGVPDERN